MVNNVTVGGAEILTVRLGTALVSRGHEVCIAFFSATNAFAAELDKAGVKYHRICPRPKFYRPWTFALAARGVASLCRRFSPDIIHSNLELADVVGQMVSVRHNYPHLICFHNVHWWAPRRWPAHWRVAYRKWWLKRGEPRFVAISDEAALVAARELGLAPAAVAVVHNGLCLEEYGDSVWLRSDSYCPSTWKILCVGRLERMKGQDIAIQALSTSALRQRDVRLLLAGDGWARTTLEDMVKTLHLEDRVTFLGTRRDIPKLLEEADLYVQPSRSEGMPIAVLEAIATGLPTIVTDLPGMREVTDSVRGLGRIVPRENAEALAGAIAELIDNPAECRRQAVLSKRRAMQFSMESTVAAYLGLYESTISESRRVTSRISYIE